MTKDKRLRALESQIRRIDRILARLEQTGNRYSWARLLTFITGFILSGLAFFLVGPWLAGIVFVLVLLVFIVVLYIHGRIERSMECFRIWLDLKQAQVARAKLDWERLPFTPTPLKHSLELDLDLVGEFSLLRLTDSAVSEGGSRRLRDWLSSTEPDQEQSLRRQRLVKELAPRPLFRDKLTLKGVLAAREDRRWHSDGLLNWLKRDDNASAIFPWLLLSAILAAINVALFLLDILAGAPPIWQGTLLIYFSLFLIKSRELDKPFREASHLRDALEQLVAVFKQLENFTYNQTPNLKDLCKAFLDPADRPSKQLARVNRVVGATGIRGNPVFWLLLNLAVPWDFYFAYLTAKRKQEIAALLPGWMDTWFEIEALSSLANLAYLNPHYAFPIIVCDGDGEPSALFRVEGLGHPLLPDKNKINNDFTAGSLGEINLFTGSNMSGKSTFLRTVGINLALAYAGGPVNATVLETIPFRLFTCIRISDSVTDGISYFYAEVKCLKALLEELNREHPLPLFYFVDEIFRGTNNRERLLGSGAYIQALVGKPGIGLIATHDLELVQLADGIPSIKNYHFTDEIVDGRMFFDYTLRPGPSPTTNALKIMEMEGLPVP
ncbi:MAG: hypothetical protein WA996_24735 [Candidatus Promineifilaceae bacterium]